MTWPTGRQPGIALARSLEQHAKLPLNEANRLVRALFCQAHPTEEKRRILDPGMLRVATSLFNDPDCAQHLSSFTQLGVDDQKRELLEMAAELETNPSPTPEARRKFSLSMLAHVRTLPPETIRRGTALCHPDTGKPDDAMRNAWRLAVRSADSTSSGPLLREFRAFSDEIYGPLDPSRPIKDSSRDFKALAEDMAVVRFPERFIRQTDLHTANISAQIVRDPANRRLYRSSLVLCRLPGYGRKCPGRLGRSGRIRLKGANLCRSGTKRARKR